MTNIHAENAVVEQTSSDFEQAYQAGRSQTLSAEYNGVPVFVIPKDMKIETLEDLVEKQMQRPYRLKQIVELLSAESFIEYYNRFSRPESTIFVDPENANFVAVFDYHSEVDGQAWKEHKAIYSCPKTKEWGSWIKSNNEKMPQADFALFIEDNMKEIVEPNGVQMLEIAASLKSTNEVQFKSNVRLDNGEVQFNYTENINGGAGVAGQLTIPEKIKLHIKPFLNGHPYEMEARFRYRITQSGLVMWYTLIRPHLVQKDAVDQVCEQIKSGMNQGQLLHAKSPQ